MLVYLHGFASGPKSSKAQRFREKLAARGLELVVPDLEEGDFERLTLGGMLALVERTLGADPCPVLVGSSLGGYVAALHAARHRVAALVLMAPAFDFAGRLRRRYGEAAMAQWRAQGRALVDHPGRARKEWLGWGLMEEAARHEAFPPVSAPTLVFQGDRDETVPPEAVREWCARTPSARLVMLESGHDIVAHTERMFEESMRFLAGLPEVRAAHPALAAWAA